MASIWKNPPQSFIRFPLAALAYPQPPRDVMESILKWSTYRVGSDIARKPDVVDSGLSVGQDLRTELKTARKDLWETYKPKNQAETLMLLGAVALNVIFNGGSIAASVVRAEALTKWLLETGAMAVADSWKGVNTVTMTMNGMGKCNAWWNAIDGVRAQAQGGVDRSEGQLTWDEFRVYAAILSVTGQDQWGRCSREEIAARAAGWVGKKKRQLATDAEVARRRAAGLMLSDKAVRSIVNYLENSGRLAKARYGHRTVFFGVGITRDELWDKIRDMMKKRALAKSRASNNRQVDLQRTKSVRDAIKRELSGRKANGPQMAVT